MINDIGKPISQAHFTVRAFNRHVFTDTDGFFKLYMKNPKLAALIIVQSTGYNPVSTELKPASTIIHTMLLQATSSILSKVVAPE